MIRTTRKIFFTLTISTILLLAGCANMTSQQQTGRHVISSNAANQSAAQYLALADRAQSPQKEAYQLQAVDKLLQGNVTDRAQQVLNNIQQGTLTPDLTLQKDLLTAKVNLLDNRPNNTINALQTMPPVEQLPPNLQLSYRELAAQAYAQIGKPIQSMQQRVALSPLLAEPQQKESNDLAIWQSAQQIPEQSLQHDIDAANSSTLSGWLQLSYIAKIYANNPQQLIEHIQAWQQAYPKHPANTMLPRSYNVDTALAQHPQHIALLLPLHGQLGSSAQAIRNGFFTAYYQYREKYQDAPTITVYDTSKEGVNNAYQKAVKAGANFVVGPLTKSNLQKLIDDSNINVPTLALNTLPNLSSHAIPSDLYQFGLLPQDEAQQAASRAWQDGHSHALIIVPDSEWGKNVAQAFTQQWLALGGKVTTEINYQTNSKLSTDIKQALNVNQSQARSKTIAKIINADVKATPRRRQDVDMIFLAASPQTARQIMPLLRFYYAGRLPIYATSMIYSGVPKARTDRDLNGARFADMPLILGKQANFAKTRKDIVSLWPNSYSSYARLYGLGLDAYNLIYQLNRMALFPKFGVAGNTGKLFLTNNHHIYRQLEWAQFNGGVPRILQVRQYGQNNL